MRDIQRSALVPYSSAQMYAIVDDIESYPEFLPWCSGTTVHCRDNNEVEATLELQRGELRKRFRTRNTNQPTDSIEMALVDGPFHHLHGKWTFTQLSDEGSKVELDMSFEFSSNVVDVLFGRFFEEICNSLVDAFRKRADTIHG
ncbi:MAG: type II toxin-antitoxin system RatA family toxin [Woeseiaceae bacterium]